MDQMMTKSTKPQHSIVKQKAHMTCWKRIGWQQMRCYASTVAKVTLPKGSKTSLLQPEVIPPRPKSQTAVSIVPHISRIDPTLLTVQTEAMVQAVIIKRMIPVYLVWSDTIPSTQLKCLLKIQGKIAKITVWGWNLYAIVA